MSPANSSDCISARLHRISGDAAAPATVRFSIGTLVTDGTHYEAMRASLIAGGFTDNACEYLWIDNTSGDQICAYRGLDAILEVALGEYVILCHQDVRLLADGRMDLEDRLAGLSSRDANWALAGNAGGVSPGRLALRITDPHGADQNTGDLPQAVESLDENFIVVRRRARVGFSRDLSGFHYYGADICLNAAVAGYTAYVIDFHLAHLSAGRKSKAFDDNERAFRSKWCRALSPRWLQTTCALMRLSGSSLGGITGLIAERPYASLMRRLPNTRRERCTLRGN